MANNYEVVTCLTEFPSKSADDVTKEVLWAIGFDFEPHEPEETLYLYSELGPNSLEGDWFFDHEDEPEYEVHPLFKELRKTAGDVDPEVDWPDVMRIILEVQAKDTPHLDFQGAYWCDKARPGEFGGFWLRVTKDGVTYGENPQSFFKRL